MGNCKPYFKYSHVFEFQVEGFFDRFYILGKGGKRVAIIRFNIFYDLHTSNFNLILER